MLSQLMTQPLGCYTETEAHVKFIFSLSYAITMQGPEHRYRSLHPALQGHSHECNVKGGSGHGRPSQNAGSTACSSVEERSVYCAAFKIDRLLARKAEINDNSINGHAWYQVNTSGMNNRWAAEDVCGAASYLCHND